MERRKRKREWEAVEQLMQQSPNVADFIEREYIQSDKRSLQPVLYDLERLSRPRDVEDACSTCCTRSICGTQCVLLVKTASGSAMLESYSSGVIDPAAIQSYNNMHEADVDLFSGENTNEMLLRERLCLSCTMALSSMIISKTTRFDPERLSL